MYKLTSGDFLKGALMAMIIPALMVIQQSLDAGEFTFKWKQLAMVSISGLIAYLVKNFFTDDVKVAKKVIEKEEKKCDELKDKS